MAGAGTQLATQLKFAAELLSPVPFHRATVGYAQSGRVRTTAPSTTRFASKRSGVTPRSTH